MTVSLNRSYGAYPAGSIVSLPASTEAALIAQNIAQASAASPTTGAQISNEFSGRGAIPIGASSLTITNPNINANTKVFAVINQAAADSTLLRVERIVPAAGSVTIYGTANATAAVTIDWCIILPAGETPNN